MSSIVIESDASLSELRVKHDMDFSILMTFFHSYMLSHPPNVSIPPSKFLITTVSHEVVSECIGFIRNYNCNQQIN